MTVLTEGETAPEFTLKGFDPASENRDGDTFKEFRLSDITDRGPTLLTFYPGDFSPVCRRQLCSMRDLHERGLAGEYNVLAVSRDPLFTHEAFAYEHSLTFPLLSDVEGRVCRTYDAVYDAGIEKRGIEPGLPKRTLYVLDSDRTIEYAWQSEDPYVEPDLSNLTEKVFQIEI